MPTSEPSSVPKGGVTLPEREPVAFHGECRMLWIETTVTLAAGIVALLVVILARRPGDADALGSVSDHWIAQHRVDAP
jgi:hypothetical protein